MKPRVFFAFVAPSLALMILFIALPLVVVFVQSFQVTQQVYKQVTVETCTPGFLTQTQNCVQETKSQAVLGEDGKPVVETRFVGFANYLELLKPQAVASAFAAGGGGFAALLNIDFYKALRFTLTFTFVTLPLVTLSLGFAAIDRSLVEAAATMGADDRTVARTVVLPLILPYLVSGYAFAFVLSLNEYIVAYMTIGFTTETLPIKIFNALRYGYTPTMASVSVFFVILAAVVFGLIARFGDIRRLLGAMTSE